MQQLLKLHSEVKNFRFLQSAPYIALHGSLSHLFNTI